MTKTYTRKSNAKVFYRVFPITNIDDTLIQIGTDEKSILVRNRQELARQKPDNDNKTNENPSFWKFESSKVFVNDDQAAVYDAVIEGVLEQVLLGYDAVILGFGQTSSGKSVTIAGLSAEPQDCGILPRLINDLFSQKERLQGSKKMAIEMSYIEYGKYCAFDLLKAYPNQIGYPFAMSKIKIKSKHQAFRYVFQGEGRKEFVSSSYMSHVYTSILTFFLTYKQVDLENPEMITSKIHIIDCAGVDSFGNDSCCLKNVFDVGTANVVKSNLEQLLLALTRDNEQTIKLCYRLNPVLNHLGTSLNNDAILRFIGHLHVDAKNLLITLSLLRFGQQITGLTMRQKVANPKLTPEMEVSYLKNELDKLKQQRTLDMLLANQVPPMSIDNERLEQMELSLRCFLKGEKSLEDHLTVSDIPTTMKLFKEMYNNFESEKERLYKEAFESAMEEMTASMTNLEHKRISESSLKTKSGSIKSTTSTAASSKRSLNTSDSKVKQSALELTKSEPSTHKKKSISSVGSKGDIKSLPSYMIPDRVVEFQEAWIKYTTEKANYYVAFIEEYKSNENEMQQAYISYIEQVALTREMKKTVQIREKEYFEIQCLLKIDDKTSTDVSVEQQLQLCLSNLKCARSNLLAQQEKALACKSNFLLHLEMRDQLKATLADDFDRYCNETFNTLLDNNNIDTVLNNFTTDLNAIKEEDLNEEVDECEEIVHKEDKFTGQMRKFRTLMDKEIEKKKRYIKIHKSLIKH